MSPSRKSIRAIRKARLSRRDCAWILVIVVLVVFAGGTIAILAQSPVIRKPAAAVDPQPDPKLAPSDSVSSASANRTIRGRVVADDGRPITNATIMAQSGVGMLTPRGISSDADGNFQFDELSPGAYTIIAIAPGFIDQSMQDGDPLRWPRHLIGEEIRITMIPGGVITGTVTNSKGEPLVGVPVNITATGDLPVFSLLLSLTANFETDDRGTYRIFGLQPGRYLVSAGGAGLFAFGGGGLDRDVPVYYPSSTRDTAVPVNVRAGTETTGIDIRYLRKEGHSISGSITGAIASGSELSPMSVILGPTGATSISAMALASSVEQRLVFSFDSIADGEYDLLVTYLASLSEGPLFGTKRVTVRGADVTGVELKVGALAAIEGRIALDPIKPENKCDKRASELTEITIVAPRDAVSKAERPSLIKWFGGSGIIEPNGQFKVLNLEAGTYRFEIMLPTEAWYVHTITTPPSQRDPAVAPATSRASNTWQGIFTIKSTERVSPVSITVGQDAAGLRGRVTGIPEAGIPGLRVHLIPVERELVDNILRYSETTVNRDGTFEFANLAPGRYLIKARVEPRVDSKSGPPRPVAWDLTARMKLRGEAEASNTIVELKPCQRVVDYTLESKTSQ